MTELAAYRYRWWEGPLRFLNLLEPSEPGGRPILSLSKLAMWQMLAINWYVAAYHFDHLVAILGATTNTIATVGNYAFRRWTQLAREKENLG